jgi:DNA-binding CsgD family transcriptional regulator
MAHAAAPRASQGLLERDRELALIQDAVDAAEQDAGRLLVIGGRPGIGKSRLLAEGCGLARRAGHRVVTARGGELEREFAFGVALQLFEAEVAAQGNGDGAPLRGAASLAAPLFDPSLSPPGPPAAGDFSFLHGLHWLAANLSEERPLLIAVDDLHWSDRPSIRFLIYLAQRLEDLPITVAVAVREDGDAFAEMASRPVARTIRLAPLSRTAVGQLVRARFPRADEGIVAACHTATQGNPFYLHELLAELDRDGARAAPPVEQVGEMVPPAVLRMVLLRLGHLPEACSALARAVAVLGNDAQFGRALAVGGLSAADGQSAADVLADVDILEVGEPLRFVHPLVRMSIYDDITARQRSVAHGRAARLLNDESASSERVASHLLASEPAAAPWAVKALRSAAERATARGAPDSAATYLRRALQEPPIVATRPDVLLALGRAESAAGLPTAIARLREASAQARDPRGRGQAMLMLGRALYASGQLKAAVEVFDDGARGLDGAAPDLALQLEAERIVIDLLPGLSGNGSGPEQIEQIMARPSASLTAPERAVLGAAAVQQAFAGEHKRKVLTLAERALGDGKLLEEETSESTTLYAVTSVLHNSGELAWDEAVLSEALDDATRRGSVMAFATASCCRSWPRLDAGRVSAAIADAERALDARRYGWEQFVTVACAVVVLGRIERGELDQAEAALALCPESEWAGSPTWMLVLKARGYLAMAEGRPEEALTDFLAWRDGIPDWNPAMYAGWRSAAGVAMAQLGRADEGSRLAHDELDRVRSFGAAPAIGVALRALGVIEGGAAGIAWLREAVGVLEASEASLEHCRALVDLGAALRRTNQRVEAREPLKQGLDMADRFGALVLAQRARDELVIAGGRPRRARLSGVDALTPGEARVAAMVADGMTNREIAEGLFVTVKAVQWHLRHIYEKLEASSRDELVAEIRTSRGHLDAQGGSRSRSRVRPPEHFVK